MYQAKELRLLIEKLKDISDDIIVYSGFTHQELIDKQDEDINYILNNIAILIDGRYIEDRNDNSFMVGSNNQQKIILNKKYEQIYSNYFANNTNQIQNFVLDDGIVSVGIHNKDFDTQIRKELSEHYEKK